ncbi:MAG: CoA ester lyase [Acidobacteriota bacterium]
MRSLLYVPGSSVKMIAKAQGSAADGIILDLEDSIPPDQKESARETVARALSEFDFGSKQVFVRINSLATSHSIEDARAIAASGKAGILIPKVQSPDDITTIAPILASGPSGNRPQRLLCLIESPRGVLSCHEIARTSSVVAGLVFGLADLVREIGCRLTAGEPEMLYARSHVLLAARATGLEAFDSPHFGIEDLDGVYRACQAARHLGYDGKTIIHPSHIAIVNEAFDPTVTEIAEAKRVVAALEEAAAAGRGAIALDGQLIDQVHLAQARKVLDRALR